MAITDNILAYWKLNDDGLGGVDLTDSTVNSYTLTKNGGATLGTGKIEGDVVFGYNDNQSLSNADISVTGDFTISMWVKFNSMYAGNGYPSIFANGTDGGTRLNASGTPDGNCAYYDASIGSGTYGTYNWTIGSWDHYVLVQSGGVITTYLNGNVNSVSNTGNNYDWTGFYIGEQGAINTPDAAIDEVGIWGRALSSAEITELYNSGGGLTYPFSVVPVTTLYYTNATGNSVWEDVNNWNTAADGSGITPANAPWIAGYLTGQNGTPVYGGYYDADLVDASGGALAIITTGISDNVTGSCDLNIGLAGNFQVWYGLNEVDIWDTNFISSGTFTRNNLNFSGGVYIFGGIFTGTGLTWSGWDIFGGTFEIVGFQNYGNIAYNSITATQNGDPFTGIWQNQIWNGGDWVGAAPILYYTNSSGDGLWSTLSNWNTAADGSGDVPLNIPWTDDGSGGAWYGDNELVEANLDSSVTIDCDIGLNVIGTCSISNIVNIFGQDDYGNDPISLSIKGGTFTGSFTNNGNISDGLFWGTLINNGGLFGGTFAGDNSVNNAWNNMWDVSFPFGITGTFTGANFVNNGSLGDSYFSANPVLVTGPYFTNNGFISSGEFIGDNVTLDGYVSGGVFSGNNASTFLGTAGDGDMDNADNWSNGIPSAEQYAVIASPVTTGTCYGIARCLKTINGGVFNGDITVNATQGSVGGYDITNTIINDGTFLENFIGNGVTINGGTFSGSDFSIGGLQYSSKWYLESVSSISNGSFSGANFSSDYTNISGGTFTYENISFTGYIQIGEATYGLISGGTFEIRNLIKNDSVIDYPNIQTTLNGDPYTGIWDGQIWDNGVWVSVVPVTILYYTNASGDGLWNTLGNWNTAADGSGSIATAVPGIDGYSGYDLVEASGGAGVTISPYSLYPAWIGEDNAIGLCDLQNVINNFIILRYVEFSSDNFINNGEIYGGTFSGNGFTNSGTISNYYSNNPTFTGYNFVNNNNIVGGEFNINGFVNNGTIDYQNITTNYDGVPYTGVWGGQLWDSGDWVLALPQQGQLAYTNATGDSLWSTLGNWIDFEGNSPTSIPWVDGYYDHDLINASIGGGYYGYDVGIINLVISESVTGTCSIRTMGDTNAEIGGGTFSASFSSNCPIYGGSFTASGFQLGYGAIYGGSFNINGFVNDFGNYISYSAIYINYDGVPYTGTWEGQEWVDGSLYVAPLSLYYTNASGDGLWSTLANWNTAADGSGYSPIDPLTETPWVTGYFNYDLIDASSDTGITIPANFSAAGSWRIAELNPVIGATNINYIINSNAIENTYGSATQISFQGTNFTNNGYIYVGSFNINGFVNNGIIDYQNITINFDQSNYTGFWEGQIWQDGSWLAEDTGVLYYTNASGDGLWSTLSNWNTAADGSGIAPEAIPWDGGYFGYDLLDASGGQGVTIDLNIDSSSTCNIPHILNYSYGGVGGTMTGDYFTNETLIGYGTFTGNYFTNNSEITGGTFSGASFTNNGAIYSTGGSGESAGTYNINGFVNNGTIEYQYITINFDGTPYTGTWEGQNWLNGVWQPEVITITKLYFTNSTGDGLWATLANWTSVEDGSGTFPTAPPWTTAESANYDLILTPEAPVPQLNGLLLGGNGIDFQITGTCSEAITLEIISNGYRIAAAALI